MKCIWTKQPLWWILSCLCGDFSIRNHTTLQAEIKHKAGGNGGEGKEREKRAHWDQGAFWGRQAPPLLKPQRWEREGREKREKSPVPVSSGRETAAGALGEVCTLENEVNGFTCARWSAGAAWAWWQQKSQHHEWKEWLSCPQQELWRLWKLELVSRCKLFPLSVHLQWKENKFVPLCTCLFCVHLPCVSPPPEFYSSDGDLRAGQF